MIENDDEIEIEGVIKKKNRKKTSIDKKAGDLVYQITEEYSGVKLIDALIRGMKLSSRLVKKSKQTGAISLNGIAGISVNCSVRVGDIIRVSMPDDSNHFEPEDIPISVVYEDEDLLIVNKPPFIVVHPTKGHPTGTIANATANYLYQRQIYTKIRFINRLDRDTSGILLIGKNAFAQQEVSKQMKSNTVEKYYYAVVRGNMESTEGKIELPIGRPYEDSICREVIDIEKGGQDALTLYWLEERFKGYDLLRVQLITGRTHQIRVHLSALGHPIIGDELYGDNHDRINRQALHCCAMTLNSPRTGEKIEAKAELPQDFKELLENLRELK